MNLQFLIFFLPLVLTVTTTTPSTEELKKKSAGFFLSMPNRLQSSTNETVCITTHFAAAPSKATIDLKLKDKHFFTSHLLTSDHNCFEIRIPAISQEPSVAASVRVQVELNSITYSSHNQDPILIVPRKTKIFIQTDRSLYKSGDKVKFRVLFLESNFLPPAKSLKISQVVVKNPIDVSVFAWENVSTELGLAQFEYHLSKDALEGKWSIQVNEGASSTKQFEVTRFVLPRFNVEILNPQEIFFETPESVIKICSRYTYGANVKGNAFLRVNLDDSSSKPLETLKKLKNGCAEFTFSKNELFPSQTRQIPSNKVFLEITGTVTEYGTDKIEISKTKSLVSFKPFTLKFANDKFFQPGHLFKGKLRVENANVDLNEEIIEICYNIAIKKSWNYLNNEQCSNFTLKTSEKEILFKIPPLKSSVIHVHLNARSFNHSLIADSALLVRLYSQSSSYILLEQIHAEKTKCRTNQQFLVQFTAEKLQEGENITLYYIVKSEGHLHKLRKTTQSVLKTLPSYENDSIIGIKHKFSRNSASVHEFHLKFKLDERITSPYRVLIYYISSSGEIIAASKLVNIETCTTNAIRARWTQKKRIPGEIAQLEIETSSPSLCALSAVDKSVTFITPRESFSKSELFQSSARKNEEEVVESARKTCLPPPKRNKENNIGTFAENEDLVQQHSRRKRFVHSFSEDSDANDIFSLFGTATITNYKTVTKLCYTGPHQALPTVQFLTDAFEEKSATSNVIRSHFPETWLWELVPVANSSKISRMLPHTVTNWVTDVFCVSRSHGVGFADRFELAAFQDFFVNVLTPFSIKRNEIMYLHVMAFNYFAHDLPVRITLKESDQFELVDLLGRKTVSYCVGANGSGVHVFEMRPRRLGEINVTVLAEVDGGYPGQCGPDVVISKRDVVAKRIRVESEGYFKETTHSSLFCVNHTKANISWTLPLPENVIPETIKTRTTITADLLAQTIENLDELLSIPTGCGEQIMSSLAPNLFILNYLKTTNLLTPSTRQKTLRNLKIGYQRILNYLHKDGSFSAFGYHDSSGSTFLTAFVLRVLQRSQAYIFVNAKVIARSVEWILANQLENGCFNTMQHVFQHMGGSSSENNTAGLTSYVIISLLDAGIALNERVKTNARYCIRGYSNLDKYTLAISSYALLRLNWTEEAVRMLKRLVQIADTSGNKMWWTSSRDSLSSDIEITSYVLLSFLHYHTPEHLAYANAIVHWLSSKQGARGGFKSTQDTVVALDALTQYAQLISSHEINLEINLVNNLSSYKFEITTSDRLKSKKVIFKPSRGVSEETVSLVVEGEGCVLARTVQEYYIKHLPLSGAFTLDFEAKSVSSIDKCSIATLSPCFKYQGEDVQASMAILDVDLPSGYRADRASLYKLLDEASSNVKKFEEIEQRVVLYLTQLRRHEQVCFNFNINENTIVQSRSESVVKLYDYYQPEFSVLQFYKVSECNSSHLPELSERKKRSGSNEFKNVDFELEFPKGLEANQPSFIKVKSNSNLEKKHEKRGDRK